MKELKRKLSQGFKLNFHDKVPYVRVVELKQISSALKLKEHVTENLDVH